MKKESAQPILYPIYASFFSGRKWLVAYLKPYQSKLNIAVQDIEQGSEFVNEIQKIKQPAAPSSYTVPLMGRPTESSLALSNNYVCDGFNLYMLIDGKSILVNQATGPGSVSTVISRDEAYLGLLRRDGLQLRLFQLVPLSQQPIYETTSHPTMPYTSSALSNTTKKWAVSQHSTHGIVIFNLVPQVTREKNISLYRGNRIIGMIYSPDDTKIIAGDHQGIITIYDVASGAAIRPLQADENPKPSHYRCCLAVSSDGKLLASGFAHFGSQTQNYRNIKIWDIETGKHLATYSDYFTNIYALSFSQDGKKLAFVGNKKRDRDYNDGEMQILRIDRVSVNKMRYEISERPPQSFVLLMYILMQPELTVKLKDLPKEFIGYYFDLPQEIKTQIEKEQPLFEGLDYNGLLKGYNERTLEKELAQEAKEKEEAPKEKVKEEILPKEKERIFKGEPEKPQAKREKYRPTKESKIEALAREYGIETDLD